MLIGRNGGFVPFRVQNERLDADAFLAVLLTEPLRLALKGPRQLLPTDTLSGLSPATRATPSYQIDSVGLLFAEQVLRPELISQTCTDLSVLCGLATTCCVPPTFGGRRFANLRQTAAR